MLNTLEVQLRPLTGSRITRIIRSSCRCLKEGQLESRSLWKTVNLEEGQLEFLILAFRTPIHKFQFPIHDIWTQYTQKSKFPYLKFGTPIHRKQSLNLNLKESQLEFPIHDIGTPIQKIKTSILGIRTFIHKISISKSWHWNSISTKIKISILKIWNSCPQK